MYIICYDRVGYRQAAKENLKIYMYILKVGYNEIQREGNLYSYVGTLI